MKILHCADIHLDSAMSTHFSVEMAEERKKELLNTFSRMVDYAFYNDIEVIIMAGDIFDKKRVSAKALNFVINIIKNHPGIDFYYLRGNHDYDFGRENDGETDGAAGKNWPENLKFFGNKWKSYILSEEGNRIILTGADFEEHMDLIDIYKRLLLDKSAFNIVTLHGQVTEYLSENFEKIPLNELRGRGIDYLALGHVHTFKYERLDDRGGYCYPGCLEGRGFDECGEHGFVVVDIDEYSGRMKGRFVPFAYRMLHRVEVDISGCENTGQIIDRIDGVLESNLYKIKDMVEVVLTGRRNSDCQTDTDMIKSLLAYDYYCLKVKDESVENVDYKSLESEKTLRGEFIRIVKKAHLSDIEKEKIIKYGLNALSGEEILAE